MPRPGRMTTERAKDFKGTLRQLLSALSQYKLSLIVVMVFAILSTIFNIAGPKILAKATTALATGWIAKLRGIGSIDFAYIDARDKNAKRREKVEHYRTAVSRRHHGMRICECGGKAAVCRSAQCEQGAEKSGRRIPSPHF